MAATPPRKLTGLTKFAIDFGPLAVFFLANAQFKIFIATAAFMAATAVAMVASKLLAGRISPMLWFTGIVVAAFGGATLWLQDETFIKVKPTILYAAFAAILLFGMATGRPLLRVVLGEAFPTLDAEGWRKLTRNWALFFVGMAGLNEVLRRVLTTDQWVDFKVFGVLALTFAFALAQAPILSRHDAGTEPKR